MCLAVLAMAMSPVPAAAAVMLQVGAGATPPCYLDSPACDPGLAVPQGSTGDSLPEPAVAAIVGLALLGLALSGRRTGMPQVVS